MLASEAANLPRWRGQPGFFEIWFLVLIEAKRGRATWRARSLLRDDRRLRARSWRRPRQRRRSRRDGETRTLEDAIGTQVHLWGTRRVEQLYWLYVPRFDDDATGSFFEASAIRARLTGPRLTPICMGNVNRSGVIDAFRRNTADVADFTMRFSADGIRAGAWCDSATLVGYKYRDPEGWDVYVAQSDVASCTAQLLEGDRVVGQLGARYGAALELHGTEPIPGVRYIEWDDER